MRTVAVYFAAHDDAGPPTGKPEYVEAYRLFAKAVAAKGGRMIVVRGAETALGGGKFSGAWELHGEEWVHTDDEVQADVVFVKDRDFPAHGASVRINSSEFEDLCSNKDETYAAFPDVFPVTAVAANEAEFAPALAKIRGDIVVVKPADGACGRDVYVGPRDGINPASLPYPSLVQECVDMSHGVPGLCAGVHDLRIVVIAGNVALCTLRTPKEGSMIANAAQGGTIRLLPVPDIPADALAVAMGIDRQLQRYPERVYSVDMGLHAGTTWKVIELNAPPGLTPPKWGSEVFRYYDLLADHLLAMAA